MVACYVGRDGAWRQSERLWAALDLEDRLEHLRGRGKDAPFVVSLAGAGGKTSLLKRLAWEGRERGLRVLALTTTHMYRPSQFSVLDGTVQNVEKMLRQESLAVAGHLEENGKISFQGWDYYREITSMAQLVLVEADGSRRLPLKVPGPNEPVVPGDTGLMLCVSGLSAIGRQAHEACFRLEQAEKLLGDECLSPAAQEWTDKSFGLHAGHQASGRWVIAPEHMERLVVLGYLKPWREVVRGAKNGPHFADVLPVFSQADTKEQQRLGMEMLERMGEKRGIVTGGLQEEPSFRLF